MHIFAYKNSSSLLNQQDKNKIVKNKEFILLEIDSSKMHWPKKALVLEFNTLNSNRFIHIKLANDIFIKDGSSNNSI